MSEDRRRAESTSVAALLAGPDGQGLLRELARGPGLSLDIRGSCMEPVLRQGDRVWVRARRFYLPGDLVAVHGAAGLHVHRFLGYRPRRRGWEVWTRADRAPRPDRAAPLGDVIGLVEDRRVDLRTRLTAGGRFVAAALLGAGRRLARLAGVER